MAAPTFKRSSKEPQYEYEDITNFLDGASSALEVGEMLCSEDFNLAEVMSAVEIMDPKMDGGFGCRQAEKLDELVDAGAVLTKPTNRQVIDIIDHLLACEFTWFDGFSLPQTVYTCIYFHRLDLLQPHPILLAYVKAVMKCVCLTSTVVNRAEVREDEEFIFYGFGLNLNQAEPVEEVIEDLAAAEAVIVEDLDGASVPEEERKVMNSILSRLRYRKNFVRALSVFANHDGLKNVEVAMDALDQCIEQFKLVQGDRACKTTPPEFLPNEVEPLEGAFSLQCLRWVPSPNPVRTIPILSWAETVAKVTKCLTDLKKITNLKDCTSLSSLFSFLNYYSSCDANVPCRSFLWIQVYNVHTYSILMKGSLQDLILSSLCNDFGAPLYKKVADEEKKEDEDEELTNIRECLFMWVDKATNCIWLIMHALCANRSRLRRKLANIFTELGVWQQLSWQTDNIFVLLGTQTTDTEILKKCNVLTAYAYEWVLWAMTNFMLLGCHLELYKKGELKAIYWYIDYLVGIQFDNHSVLYKMREDEEPALPTRGKKNRKKETPAYPLARSSRTLCKPSLFHYTYLECINYISRAIFRFMAALQMDGVDPPEKEPKFSNFEFRYENRIKPFLNLLQPQFVRYQTFVKHSDTSGFKSKDLVESCVGLLTQCKVRLEKSLGIEGSVEEKSELPALLKVCKGNLLCIQLYLSGKMGNTIAEYDWAFSTQFPVIKLKKPLTAK